MACRERPRPAARECAGSVTTGGCVSKLAKAGKEVETSIGISRAWEAALRSLPGRPSCRSRPAGGGWEGGVGAGGWTQRRGGLSLHLASLARGVDGGAGLGADGGRLAPGSGCGSGDSGGPQGAAEGSEACGAPGSVTWGRPWKIPPQHHTQASSRLCPPCGQPVWGLLTRDLQPPQERPVLQGERCGTAAVRHWVSLRARATRAETGSWLLPLRPSRRYKQTAPAPVRDSR